MSKNSQNSNPYHDTFVAMLELVWGKGFLSPGGSQAIERLLQGLDLKHKKLLDIGCGIGGVDIFITQNYPIEQLVAVDVEKILIDRANNNLASLGLQDKLFFLTIPLDQLPFSDQTFDIIFSKESWLHIENKLDFFKEVFRVLKPGGQITAIDWMHTRMNYNSDMQRFVAIDGLTFSLITPIEYKQVLQQVGFVDITIIDTSYITLEETKKDYHRIATELAEQIKSQFGEEYLKDSLESWGLQVKVFEQGELQSGIIRARKPS